MRNLTAQFPLAALLACASRLLSGLGRHVRAAHDDVTAYGEMNMNWVLGACNGAAGGELGEC